MEIVQIVTQNGEVIQKEDLKEGQVIRLLGSYAGKILLIRAIFENGRFYTNGGVSIIA